MSQSDDTVGELAWTGERYVPFVQGDVGLEHLHRYVFARDLACQKDVLDIACGEGYGSHLLADKARSVIGMDLSEEVVQHASMKYAAPGLEFRQGDCTRIPLENNSIDMVVSFETIEHHDQHEAMLAEIKRVLRPDGLLVISTPERYFLNELSPQPNEFHVKELSLLEFAELMKLFFKNCAFLSQRVRYGSLIMPMEGGAGKRAFSFHRGGSTSISSYLADPEPLYIIALASKCDLPFPAASFFDGTDFLLRERSVLQTELIRTSDRDGWVNEVGRMKATFSWRITKPLRFFWNMLHHLIAM